MKAVIYCVSLLHDIIMDFVVVFFDVAHILKTHSRRVSSPHINLPPLLHNYVFPFKKTIRTTVYKVPKLLKQYWSFLLEIYNELETETDKGVFSSFLIVSILLIIALCCIIFYKALVL